MAGFVSSIAMAMMEMIYEGLFGVGFWAAPVFIAATILRTYQVVALPVSFALLPVLVGMMGHMMNSVILDSVFTKSVSNKDISTFAAVFLGSAYGVIIFFVMWSIILPLVNPVMLHLNPVVFALSHIVWGGIIGMMAVKKSA